MMGNRIAPTVEIYKSVPAACVLTAQSEDFLPEFQAKAIEVSPNVTRIGIAGIQSSVTSELVENQGLQ